MSASGGCLQKESSIEDSVPGHSKIVTWLAHPRCSKLQWNAIVFILVMSGNTLADEETTRKIAMMNLM
jgi:hypothetical protein